MSGSYLRLYNLFQILLLINGQRFNSTMNIASTVSIKNEAPSLPIIEECVVEMPNGISVTSRTSSSFTALITYNCSSINPNDLNVIFNRTGAVCYVTYSLYPSRVTVECNYIENNAGRNWTFDLIQNNVRNQIIHNETFTITLKPLSLNLYALTSPIILHKRGITSIYIPDCAKISDPKYLAFRCNHFDLWNQTLSDNCTCICSNLQPGSIYNGLLIRLTIPIADDDIDTFEQESIHIRYSTDLDKTTIYSFSNNAVDKNMIRIYFTRPRGNYDGIELSCRAIDQSCSSGSTYLVNSTGNCSSCNSIDISPLIRGVKYSCQATTSKKLFTNVLSDPWDFSTPLEPASYSGPTVFDRSLIDLIATTQSDYSSIELICFVDDYSSYLPSISAQSFYSCATRLTLNGTLGYNYGCYFITKKSNYSDVYSGKYLLTFNVYTNTFVSIEEPSKSSVAWIAVFPGLLVVIIVALIVWRRRQLKQCWTTKQNKKDLDLKTIHLSNQFFPHSGRVVPPLYVYHIQPMNPKLLVEYINLSTDDETNLQNEFQELKSVAPKYNPLVDPCTNMLFDRYNDIPSRDSWNNTAVWLTAPHRSHDYINANLIRGVNSDKQYIACQSPLENTCEHFWDMIIQYNITKIVMLNQFVSSDSETNKSYPYIPMNINGLVHFGRINVETKNIQFSMNNHLEIRNLIIRENENRFDIVHYLFNNWSGSNVISSEDLIDLIETVNHQSAEPIVIHCSSGTGRTGTYIVVDIIIRLLNQSINNLREMKVDVMGIVNQLKHDRVNMVQTPSQYVLIHRCIEEYLRKQNRLNDLMRSSNNYEIIKDDETSNKYYGIPNSDE